MAQSDLDDLFAPSGGLLRPVRGTPEPSILDADEGVDPQIITAAWVSYTKIGSVDIDYVNEQMGFECGEILSSEAGLAALEERGIPPESKKNLVTTEQVMALQIIFAPTSASFETRLKRADVTITKWQTWLRNPAFNSLYRTMGEQKLVNGVPTALSAMTDKAADGDMAAIKLLLEMTGRYDPGNDTKINLMSFMRKVVDVIQEELMGDPEKMISIAKRLKALSDSEVELQKQTQMVLESI